jgi:lipooligosaccharide transport system permease protein
VISAVLTPLFLVAGTFFPLSQLPHWAQIAGNLNPLHHCVELVRHAAFGWHGWSDLARVGALIGFALAAWRLAIFAMTRKLVS